MRRAKAAHVCILKADGTPAGGGVLVSRTHIVTCSHVAALAWGEDIAFAQHRRDPVALVFPFRDFRNSTATIRHFTPYVPGEGGSNDLAILELDTPFDQWATLMDNCSSIANTSVMIHSHHTNGKIGAQIDGTVVCRLPDGRIQVGGGDRTGAYFIRPGASGCGAFSGDDLLGITAIYDTEPGVREGYLIGAPLIQQALNPLLAGAGRPKLRLALGDDYEEARPNLAKAEFICGTQQASNDGRLSAFLECGFDQAVPGTARLASVELRAMLPQGSEATSILRNEAAEDSMQIAVRERGKSDPRRPVWSISAPEGETLCDQKVRCQLPAFILETVDPGQIIGAELVVYANAGYIENEHDNKQPSKNLSVAKRKLMKRLDLKTIGEPGEDGAIVLCRASRIVEEIPE